MTNQSPALQLEELKGHVWQVIEACARSRELGNFDELYEVLGNLESYLVKDRIKVSSVLDSREVEPSDLDPEEADRKYASIAIACVWFMKNRARSPVAQESVLEMINDRLRERDFTFEDFDRTLQWLEDNSQ